MRPYLSDQVIAEIAALPSTSVFNSEVAPDEVCFFCGREVEWDEGLRHRTEPHEDDCLYVRAQEVDESAHAADALALGVETLLADFTAFGSAWESDSPHSMDGEELHERLVDALAAYKLAWGPR